MRNILEDYKESIEAALAEICRPRGLAYDGLLDSMQYSLMAGGKRLRPALVLEFCRCTGGDAHAALAPACAVEMIHTYSLIHDDLPCMDDDDLRRGKPTNHVVYGECTATLAGDALQAEAFSVIMESDLTAEAKVNCAAILARAAGTHGMCAGQFLDTVGEGQNLTDAQLREIHGKKTGCMIAGACEMGVAAAGGSAQQREAARTYGMLLGLAFQIRDDMLDEISSIEELGKPICSDQENEKTTFMSLYGAARCQELVDELTAEAKAAAAAAFADTEGLCALADQMTRRMN